jgi:hypothetical protein
LSRLPEADRFLIAFARAHHALQQLAASGELRARDRIAYTRRNFLQALGDIDQSARAGLEDRQAAIAAAWRAIRFAYLGALTAEEQSTASALLEATGIGEAAWELAA